MDSKLNHTFICHFLLSCSFFFVPFLQKSGPLDRPNEFESNCMPHGPLPIAFPPLPQIYDYIFVFDRPKMINLMMNAKN